MEGAPKPRRWFRFSLRALFIAVTVGCVWLGFRVHYARQQATAIAALNAIDGYYYYDFQFEAPSGRVSSLNPGRYYPDRTPPGPDWIWNVVGTDLGFDVIAVGLNTKPATDETLELMSKLSSLQVLDLAAAEKVTDTGLNSVSKLRNLTYLRVDGTSISASAIADFKKTHPATTIEGELPPRIVEHPLTY